MISSDATPVFGIATAQERDSINAALATPKPSSTSPPTSACVGA